uniref:Ycf49-like protein n=3 Tax=Aegilops tauschii TaxID=37682 RepID=A0A453LCW8_AEGTS
TSSVNAKQSEALPTSWRLSGSWQHWRPLPRPHLGGSLRRPRPAWRGASPSRRPPPPWPRPRPPRRRSRRWPSRRTRCRCPPGPSTSPASPSGVTAMALVWDYGERTGLKGWKGLSWGMVPLLGGAMCACTWHFFYNSESLEILVAIQGALTVIGNITMCIAAYRIYKGSQESTNSDSP